ncbi:hypothetical protein [Spiroplasma endosymbiont of Virgichneumon dumeticola]|uniref:hypothetical protein n=1 Tax=Spiroplasma endosymbiont of Virgichneumon dumeticola TaxID=3139323 RepID=UPI0035C8E45D
MKKIVEQHFTTFLESEKQYTNMPDQESTWTKSTEMKKKNRSKPTTSTPQLTIKPSPKSSNFIISFVDDSLKLVNNFMNNLTSSTKKHESKLKATEVIDNINKKISAINTWFKKNSISKDKQTYYYDGQKLVLKTLHESVETRIKILNKEWFEMRKKLRNSIKNQNNIKLDVLQKDFVRLKMCFLILK